MQFLRQARFFGTSLPRRAAAAASGELRQYKFLVLNSLSLIPTNLLTLTGVKNKLNLVY